MTGLTNYIIDHTERGECQCGECCDKATDRAAPPHSMNVHFFWVSLKNEPSRRALDSLLKAEYPSPDRLKQGPSYIEIGAEVGSQDIALRLIGLGDLLGLWRAVTPERLGMDGQTAAQMAGNGFVMAGGWKELEQ